MRGIGFLLPTLVLQACFDVHQVDPGNGRFVIDDFEDGDPLPKATPLFRQWQCYTYNPNIGQDPAQIQTVSCDVRPPGDKSDYAMVTKFALHNLPNEDLQGGAALVTSADPMVDLNGYQNLVFNLRVDFGDLPSTSFAYVALDCDSVTAESKKVETDLFQVEQRIPAPSNSWSTITLPLSKFAQPTWQNNRFADGTQACLAVVDSINFGVNGQLVGDQSGHGVIYLDDVSLQ